MVTRSRGGGIRTRAGGILSPLPLPLGYYPDRQWVRGGAGTQIRTGGEGFAILCLTTWPCRLCPEGRVI